MNPSVAQTLDTICSQPPSPCCSRRLPAGRPLTTWFRSPPRLFLLVLLVSLAPVVAVPQERKASAVPQQRCSLVSHPFLLPDCTSPSTTSEEACSLDPVESYPLVLPEDSL
jgi:hypothetical protein